MFVQIVFTMILNSQFGALLPCTAWDSGSRCWADIDSSHGPPGTLYRLKIVYTVLARYATVGPLSQCHDFLQIPTFSNGLVGLTFSNGLTLSPKP
jgi:hypothetical protein